jgi:hypothetical protein
MNHEFLHIREKSLHQKYISYLHLTPYEDELRLKEETGLYWIHSYSQSGMANNVGRQECAGSACDAVPKKYSACQKCN